MESSRRLANKTIGSGKLLPFATLRNCLPYLQLLKLYRPWQHQYMDNGLTDTKYTYLYTHLLLRIHTYELIK